MGESLKVDVQSTILSIPDIKEVDVELVWGPPWDPSMTSDAAKVQLGFM